MTEDRIAFHMEVSQGDKAHTSYVSVRVQGYWDLEMVDALLGFIVRQRRRLQRRGPLMLADIWDFLP